MSEEYCDICGKSFVVKEEDVKILKAIKALHCDSCNIEKRKQK